MKRVVSSKSGKDIYGPKWQNIESSSSESERDDELHSPPLESTGTAQTPVSNTEAAKPESSTITSHGKNNENQIPKGKIVGSRLGESMYRAAFEGDWVAAEVLLDQDPNLARDYVTEEADRALHVAASMKHTIFVQKLVERISNPRDLELLDGRGNTACCYAAILGAVEIARAITKKNPNWATARDKNNETPLHKAALHGKKEMVSYFLENNEVKDLSKEEWFDLLLITIRCGMYDAAIEILGKNGSIATMANEEGTALHLLARHASIDDDDDDDENDASDFNKMVRQLWAEMQKMEKSSLLELIKNPHNILHDAAKEGHVEIVTMLIRTYPQLISDTDSNGYTIFHTAVKYRNIRVFNLIREVYAMIDFKTLISQDQSGDNILHLAAKLAPPNKMKLHPVRLMRKELAWFKAVEKILPPSCVMTRNNDNLRPRDLFSKQHKKLLINSEMWMRNTADSCMLIATLLLSVMFAAAFAVPGGYDSQTGEPMLAKRHWFKIFVTFEVLGIIASVFSIIMFRSIMASSFAKEDFVLKLEDRQKLAFQALLWSLACGFSAFMSSISLYNLKMNALVWFGFCTLCLVGSFWLYVELFGIYKNYRMNQSILLTRRSILRNQSYLRRILEAENTYEGRNIVQRSHCCASD